MRFKMKKVSQLSQGVKKVRNCWREWSPSTKTAGARMRIVGNQFLRFLFGFACFVFAKMFGTKPA